jgi:hypothetical protein
MMLNTERRARSEPNVPRGRDCSRSDPPEFVQAGATRPESVLTARIVNEKRRPSERDTQARSRELRGSQSVRPTAEGSDA